MNYRVVHAFRDLQDKGGHVYLIGDVFPFDGYTGEISEDRIKELTGPSNKARKPVIVAVEDKVEQAIQVAVGTVETAVAKKTTRKKAVKKEAVEGE